MPEQVDFLLCPFTDSRCDARCALALSLDGKRVCGLNTILSRYSGNIEPVCVAPAHSSKETKREKIRERISYIQEHPDEFPIIPDFSIPKEG